MNFAGVLILLEFDNLVGTCVSPFLRKYDDMLVIKRMNSKIVIFAQAASAVTFLVLGTFFAISYLYDRSHMALMTMTNYFIATITWFVLFFLYSYITVAANKEFTGFGFVDGIGQVDSSSSSSSDEEEGNGGSSSDSDSSSDDIPDYKRQSKMKLY